MERHACLGAPTAAAGELARGAVWPTTACCLREGWFFLVIQVFQASCGSPCALPSEPRFPCHPQPWRRGQHPSHSGERSVCPPGVGAWVWGS